MSEHLLPVGSTPSDGPALPSAALPDEAKIKKLEYERSMIAMRSQYPAGAPPPVQPAAAGQKRAGGGGHHAPPGKRRH